MIINDYQRVEEHFELVQQQAIKWLQRFTSTSHETLDTLLNLEEFQLINRTNLRSLFDSLEFVSPAVIINFYSQQADIHEDQSFYVEVIHRTSDFSCSIPLHSSLIPKNHKKGETISFFKYVFIQIALVQYASDQNIQITASYINEILNYFYKQFNVQEPIKEDLQMEEKQGLFTFKLKSKDNSEELTFNEPPLKDTDDFEEDLLSSFNEVYVKENDETEMNFIVEDDLFDAEEEYELEETVGKVIAIDFEQLNEQFNSIYKCSPVTERESLKQLKADIWAVEMKMEEQGLAAEDVTFLIQNILDVDSDDKNTMKWQISTTKQLLEQLNP